MINPSCHNPCHHIPPNTAANEDLQSQVENFALNFFGDLIRTEINGVVNWSLPCRLDIGLPSNPRGSNEPLGCYFLRLLEQGVIGLQGEDGFPGNNGANGRVAYISGGATIFGPQGQQGPVGNTGQQGPQGRQGPPGATNTWFTTTNATGPTALNDVNTGNGYPVTGAYTLITNTTAAQVTLPATGTYYVLYSAACWWQINNGNFPGVRVNFKLTNSTQGADVVNSSVSVGGDFSGGAIQSGFPSTSWGGILTGNAGDVVGLYVQSSQTADFNFLTIPWAAVTVVRVA